MQDEPLEVRYERQVGTIVELYAEIEKLTRALDAAQDEIRELTRQRDDARDLVARSGYFIDCEKGAGKDCVMWHSAGKHEEIASELGVWLHSLQERVRERHARG